MRIRQRAPDEIGASELAKIEALIIWGGEVYAARLHENLPRAVRIVTAYSWGRLVGASAVKAPTPDYRAAISQRSNFDLSDFPDEYGYTVVRKGFRGRGLGTTMMRERLRLQRRPAFATVRADNLVMNKILSACTFQNVGREWQGRNGALCLWIFNPTMT